MTKSDIARKGGLALVKKRGKNYMRQIGQRGGISTHARYQLQPIGINDFAFIDRETGKPLPKTICGKSIQEYL